MATPPEPVETDTPAATPNRAAGPYLIAALICGVAFAGGMRLLDMPKRPSPPTDPPAAPAATTPSRPPADFFDAVTNAPTGGQPVSPPEPRPTLTPKEVFAHSSPSVAQVTAMDRTGREVAAGTAFLITSNGLYATNYHVIEKAHTATVRINDRMSAVVQGIAAADEDADLALLAVGDLDPHRALPSFASLFKIQPLELDPAVPAVGSKVYAIGNPLGLENSLSDGLVSGHRLIDGVNWIQSTAPISPGSSGGPLLAENGRVVGVTTSLAVGGQNLNFAVPALQVARLLSRPAVKPVPLPIARRPDDVSLVQSGYEKWKAKDYDGAIKDYDEAIRMNPRFALAYASRGMAWSSKGEYARAEKDYSEAIRHSPQGAHYHAGRGNVRVLREDFDGALKDFDEALRLDPKNDGVRAARDTAAESLEDQLIERVRQRLRDGMGLKDVTAIILEETGKTRADSVDVCGEEGAVAEFGMLPAVAGLKTATVLRYSPCVVKRLDGRPVATYRLRLLFNRGRLLQWRVW